MSRKQVEQEIYGLLDEMTHDKANSALYKAIFSNMDDKAFDKYMVGIRDGKRKLIISVPNHSKAKLSLETNLSIAKRYGHDFFQHLIIGNDNPDIPAYKTPEKYLIIDLPVKRPSQTVAKKISVSGDTSVKDSVTKQAAGDSKAASISLAEINVLKGLGFDLLVEELNKARGGDEGYFNSYNKMANALGEVSLDRVRAASTGTESKEAVKNLMLGQHLRSNL